MMDDENIAEIQRDRSRRAEKGSRFSDANSDSKSNIRDRSTNRNIRRVYVSNIPYEYRWQDLKDLFRRVVGAVDFVELFVDENFKPRGCGIVEFKDAENVAKCLEKMNRYELNGRELVVKQDHGEERDKYGRIGRGGSGSLGGGGGSGGGSGGGTGGGGGGGSGDNSGRGGSSRGNGQGGGGGGGNLRDRDMDRGYMMNRGDIGGGGGGGGGGVVGGGNNYNMNMNRDYDSPSSYNTYGLSTSFLDNLGIQGPLHTKVFVANLDYKVDAKKLKEVFKLAGRIVNIDLASDKDGNSRGFAVVDYEHPVEAVQAISMFDRQLLFERRMTVRLDRVPDKNEKMKLPEGLAGIGMGLGPNGEPLRNVALNLPNLTQQNSSVSNINNNNNLNNLSNINNTPVPVAPPNGPSSILGPVPNSNNLSENLAALNSVVGSLGNLGALSNPLLTSAAASLNSLGLNLGGAAGNADLGGSANNSSFSNLNQQSVPSNYSTGYGNTNYNTNSRNSDYDSAASQMRNYNTQPQDDFNRGGGGVGGGNFNNGNLAQVLGQQLGGNMKTGGRCSDTILIRNLPQSCTWQTLRDKFRDVGEVKFAEIRGQDCGVVRFSKERDAEIAIKIMDGARFDGRIVDVSYL